MNVDCIACGSKLAQKKPSWLFQCPRCGLLSSSLTPEIPTQKSETLIDEQARLDGLSAPRAATNNMILDVLSSALPQNSLVLDVGCGHGLLLNAAVAAGFRAEGVEPDANVVERARQNTGVSIKQGFFPDVLADDERFDAIIFNDVLEHIPTAVIAVEASAKHLRSGGILVLNCPDKAGIFYRMAKWLNRIGISGPFDRMWQKGLPSPHVWYFSEDHLKKLGSNAELQVIKTLNVSPVSAKGLYDRISYVEGQSKTMNRLVFAIVTLLTPFLGLLPKDSAIVFFRKN